MKNRNFWSLMLILMVLTQSCLFSDVKRESQQFYPPIPFNKVVVFKDSTDLPDKYTKVAMIHVNYPADWEKGKWNRAVKRCAALGANGLYLIQKPPLNFGERVVIGFTSRQEASFMAFKY